MTQDKVNKIDISDIQTTYLYDGKKRHLLDSTDKIIRWIKYGFSQQEKIAKGKSWKLDLEIDLSDCVLYTNQRDSIEDSSFSLLEVINEAKKDGCDFFDCDGDDHNSSKRFVKSPFKCNNSIFYYGNFKQTSFLENVTFENTIFVKDSFSRCDFKRYISFQGAKFLSSAQFEGSNFNYSNFDNAEFSISLSFFIGCSFNGNISFDSIKFSTISTQIFFRKCIFKENLTFKNVRFTKECHFIDSVFGGVCSFENCSFDFPVFFNNSVFDGVCSFENCSFDSTVFFDYATINKQLIIHNIVNTTAISSLGFTGATILGRLELIGVKATDFIGTNISIQSEGLLRLAGCEIEDVELSYLVNKGIILLQNNDLNIKRIDLSVGANFGIIEVSSTQIQCKNRATARMLKDSAYRSNNTIDAIYYKSEEHKLYKRELDDLGKQHINKLVNHYSLSTLKIIISLFIIVPTILISFCIGMYIYVLLGSLLAFIFVWTPIGKWIKKSFEYLKPLFSIIKKLPVTEQVLLWLNTISNKNGQSWWRGFIFTIAVALLFFILINCWGINNFHFFELGWRGWDSFGEVWKSYLNMFYLIDFKDKFDGFQLNALGETLFMVSKIFVGYGIYQTISAFRKYGK